MNWKQNILYAILITTISASFMAACHGAFEMSVMFSFWASLACSIYSIGGKNGNK